MALQVVGVGITCSPYRPAGSCVPPIMKAEVEDTTVFSLAPARPTESDRTYPPQIFLPFTAGR
jgi:hypothetical protein